MNKQNWLNTVSNISQFVLGFLLGVALIGGSAVGAAYFYFRKASSSVPQKPIYQEETTVSSEDDILSGNSSDSKSKEPAKQTATKTSPSKPSQPKPQKKEPVVADLPPNAYFAIVTWPQGLSLRANADLNAARIGGVAYNAKIIILGTSADKKWQQVRVPWSEQEGWVKNGNTKRASY